MAPNPLRSAAAWLRGDDLKGRASLPTLEQAAASTATATAVPPAGSERKFIYYDGIGAAIRMGTLVNGPGATELLGQAFGNWGQDANSAVYACLSYLCTAYPDAPLRVWKDDKDGKAERQADHALEALIRRPNPHMSMETIWYWVQWAKHAMGNAYLRKLRAGDKDTGNVVQLWPISPAHIWPITTDADRRRGVFITNYKYEYETGKYEYIPPHNIIHFRLGVDDHDHRLGTSPLKRLVKSIATDDQAEAFCLALLNNYAVPGMVVSTKDADMTAEDAQEIKERITANFGGENRGNVAILNNGATAEQFGYSPDQMDTSGVRRAAEERISACLHVPAFICGLGAGLDHSIYNNAREAKESFAENTLLPQYAFDAATINLQLLPDFESDPKVYAKFDVSDMRALQEDEDKKYARLDLGVKGKWIKRNEARADVGLPPVEGWDEEDEKPAPPPTPPQLPMTTGPRPGQARIQETPPRGKAFSAVDVKANRVNLDRYPDLFAAMVDLAAPALEHEMEAYFEGQRRRVVSRLLADPLDQGTADPATARAALPRL
jgi:HK97 family phage portal protein